MPSTPFRSTHTSTGFLLLALLLSACSKQNTEERRSDTDSGAAIVIRDAVGETVRLNRPAERVISLAPNITEILFAIDAGDRVVGRTTFCNYPPEVNRVPAVGDMVTVDYERTLGLKPDLALLSVAAQTGEGPYRKLRSLGVPTAAFSAETIAGTINTIDTIGLLVGKEREAGALTARMRSTVDSVRRVAASGSHPRVFIVIDRKPLMTVSKGFIAEMVETAGGVNIASGGAIAYPTWPHERLLRDDPDAIIVPGSDSSDVGALLALYPEMADLRAVRTGRIYYIPTDLISRPGPRIVEGIVALRRALEQAGGTR